MSINPTMALGIIDITRLLLAVALYRKQIKKAVPAEAPFLLDGIDDLVTRMRAHLSSMAPDHPDAQA